MEKEVGRVFDYFSKVGVAAIKLTDSLKVGDRIHIKGSTTDFETTVESMQINRESISEANAGDDVGIKVPDRVRPNDKVFVITED